MRGFLLESKFPLVYNKSVKEGIGMKIHKAITLLVIFLIISISLLESFGSIGIKFLASKDAVVFCHDPNILKGIRILGFVITIIKVLVPVLLIVVSIKTMVNAVLEQDDAAIKPAVYMFIKKFIAGAIIFFVPTIVHAIMSSANGYDKTNTQFTECGKCLTSVKSCNSLIERYS